MDEMIRGYLPLAGTWGREYQVFGGPFRKRPEAVLGVKMAKEINAPCDINIPTVDFDVPPKDALLKGLNEAVDAILVGTPVYVGCMEGKGRTGLFMSLLAKAWGIYKPVEYVRQHYYPHAVETSEQYKFVQDFVIPENLQGKIFWGRLFNLKFRRKLTDDADRLLKLVPSKT